MSAKQTPESFWARVDVRDLDECWPWLGGRNGQGYGSVMWRQHVFTAHRVAAWLLGFVEHPSAPRNRKGDGFILHTCDFGLCCNPTHWDIGTYAQNQRDSYSRSRRAAMRGSMHRLAKLTEIQAAEVRSAYAQGVTQETLAARYGLSQAGISRITLNKSYRVRS